MKIIHVNYSDISGGAARAAYRIHHALLAEGVESRMMVNSSTSGDCTVTGPASKWGRLSTRLRSSVGGLFGYLASNYSSHAILPSAWPARLNQSDADVLNLHWIGSEMLSIADIGKLHKPVVWTLHDMWAFCGAEHYTDEFRWRDGYQKGNRSSNEPRYDLNRWAWNRKVKHWRKPIHIITPSQWLADCARESQLMRDWPISVVPNCINTECWKPSGQAFARQLFQLPLNVPLLLFGAIGGTRDPRKGFDLLQEALNCLRGEVSGLELVVFGQLPPKVPLDLGFPVHYIGNLHDDVSLSLLYSAADMVVVPSRLEAFGQTASEAHSCGTPVVAFNVGGLPDIVKHRSTGYLCTPFDTGDLAQGIEWVLSNSQQMQLGQNARSRAVELFSYPVVAAKYLEVYRAAVRGTY